MSPMVVDVHLRMKSSWKGVGEGVDGTMGEEGVSHFHSDIKTLMYCVSYTHL